MLNRIVTRLPGPAGRAVEMNGHVFGAVTAAAMVVLLAVAARQQQAAVVGLLGFALATIAISKLWSGLALRGVTFTRVLDKHALFPGEHLEAQFQVANNKLLPMPWAEAVQDLPAGLGAPEGGAQTEGEPRIRRSFSLPWYSRITWNERIAARRRGSYVLPGLEISSGDILGLYPRAKNGDATGDVVVYPRLYPVHHLSAQRTDSSGERVGLSTLQEDPTRMRGIRDYAPGDGLRRVHWKVTARYSDLKVKLLEPAAVSRVYLALVADSFEASDADNFELAVSSVASVARFCIERQQQVGLCSNVRVGDTDAPACTAAGAGNRHLLGMLELLARVNASAARPFPVLANELRRLALAGTALIVVTGRLQHVHAIAFEKLARTNWNFRVLVVDSRSLGRRVTFPCTFVRAPDDLLAIGGPGR